MVMSFEKATQFVPRPVVEVRRLRDKPGKFEFHAEVMFDGNNYILSGNPHQERDDAYNEANALVNKMEAAMLEAGRSFVKDLPVAKE